MNLRTLLPIAALATACAGPQRPAAPAPAGTAARAPADYYPLAIGNEWTFRDETPGMNPQAASTRTVRIVSRTTDGYFKDSDRGELRADPDCLHDRTRRLLCTPIQKGSAWSSVVSVSSTEKYEIAGVDEKVQTPSGTYDGCVRVRATNKAGPGTELVLEISYAPGVGPVRIETFVLAGGKAIPQLRAVLDKVKIAGR